MERGAQLVGKGQVAIATFGDGTSNIGAYPESLNMAAVWKLPVIFVCQNNLNGEHTTFDKATAARQFSDHSAGHLGDRP